MIVVIPLALPLVMLGLILALARYEELVLGGVKETKGRVQRRRHLRAMPHPAEEANTPVDTEDRTTANTETEQASDTHTRHRGRPRHAA